LSVLSAQSIKPLSVAGTYCKTEKFAGICLQLKIDSNYLYSQGTDIHTSTSNGIWKIKKDTLILNSSIQKNNLAISIQEITSQKSDSLVFIEIPTNLSNDLMPDATIYINDDTLKHCMPAFINDCRFLKRAIKKNTCRVVRKRDFQMDRHQ